jgi:hypothetical protein
MSGVIVLNQLSAEIVSADGYSAVVLSGNSLDNETSGVLLAGTDGYTVSFIRTNSDGVLQIDPIGTTVQPISGTVASNQSGIWYVRLTDGYGNPVLVRTSAAQAGDPGVVVRVASSTTDGYVASLLDRSKANTASRTTVANTTVATTILSNNDLRKGATIYNSSNKLLYIAFGPVDATLASFTALIATNGYYELPYGFTGRISGIWGASGSGGALVTELT